MSPHFEVNGYEIPGTYHAQHDVVGHANAMFAVAKDPTIEIADMPNIKEVADQAGDTCDKDVPWDFKNKSRGSGPTNFKKN